MSDRLRVAKTTKLYLGGAFVRSESGHSLDVIDHHGAHIALVPRGSRKDARDAVKAARAAVAGWSGRTAYNRGQILYRLAEALESRADEVVQRTVAIRGVERRAARTDIETAVDLAVHYAGWTDKLHAVMGAVNPVAAPYFGFSLPEPTGVVVVLTPDEPDVLGLVREVLPPLAAGNTVVALVSERWPLVPLDLGEVFAVSDVPGGVVNLLSGLRSELIPHLCGHRDVNAIVDATGDDAWREQIGALAAETVKRVSRPAPDADPLSRLEALTELKTAWHPVGV
jgi:acyl-CoA reductase-like NAD-dependent aldehyde dehydrogenase